MSFLTEKVPIFVEFGGSMLKINADFRTMLEINRIIEEDSESADTAQKCLELFYGYIPEAVEDAVDKLIWFYRCGEKDKEEDSEGEKNISRTFSFTHDANLIYAAFLQQYGIDLQDTDLHWWKFRALLDSLTDTAFNDVCHIRTADTSKMGKEQKQQYEKLKKTFALPLPESEQEFLDALTEALMNGGDIEEVKQNYGC